MRCHKCPALVREGYEYPEEYCSIYPEDEIVDFSDGDCGCKHPLVAIRKRLQQNENAREKEYDGIRWRRYIYAMRQLNKQNRF